VYNRGYQTKVKIADNLMGNQEPLYLKIIADEFKKRKNINSKYSLRTFATRMQIDPTYLSKCLAKKQTMSFAVAEKIVAYLNLQPSQRIDFLRSIAEHQSCMSLHKHDRKATTCDDC
jgi:hypothetical protein